MVKLRIFVLLSVLILGLLGTTGSASAVFLCPVVGDGVINLVSNKMRVCQEVFRILQRRAGVHRQHHHTETSR
jgi:hypothetical protein